LRWRLEPSRRAFAMTFHCARESQVDRRRRAVLLAAVTLGVLLSTSGCAKRRVDAAPAAPPVAVPMAAPALEPPPGPLSEPQTRAELPAPQDVPDGAAPDTKGPFAYQAPEITETPASPKPTPRPVRPASSEAAPATEPTVEAAAPPPVPQLGPLISDEQRQAYDREIDRNLDLARTALNSLMGRRLSSDQSEGVRRIREFLRQVEESRASDVALARNLADRARLLAEDLVRNSR
jgi:hypothetical protein